jgi:hypothetical protein
MNNRASGAEGSCRHRNAHSEELLKKYGHDCPTDLAFWCANDILADIRKMESQCRIRRESHDERLRAEFGGILERNLALSSGCDGVQTFWSLDEKSIEAHDIVGDDPRQRLINRAILELNANYHSHPLLWRLVGLGLGRSHVFSVESHEGGACLIIRPLLCLLPEKGSQEWPIPVPLDSGRSVHGLLAELRGLADQAESELATTVKRKIKDQIDAWIPPTWAGWPQDEFEARLRDADERQDAGEHDFQALFREAARHIALIMIYQACNGFGTLSYIMAPTLQGRCESSLAIYWPRTVGEGSLNLLYLLQMILGQNATAILGEQRERQKFQQLAEARKMALGHLGHTLKHRLDTVTAYLDRHGQEALSGHVLMLGDLTVILQLNTVDDQKELLTLEKRKRDRFLEYADGERSGPLDLKGLILRDWSDLVARERSFSDEGERIRAWCRLDMHSRVATVQVTYALTDGDGRRCRVSATVYRELLFELLLNARRYGYVGPCPGEMHDDLPVVSVRCDLGTAEVHDRKLLTLVNQVHPGKELPAHLQSVDWRPWPAARKYDGPGMALELFRRLELGDLFYRSQALATGEVFFVVGLELLGLEIV